MEALRMRILGRKERPRLLVLGVEEGGDLGRHLEKLVPTIRFLNDADDLAVVRQLDWDAVFCSVDFTPELESHLYVLQFGGSSGGDTFEMNGHVVRVAWTGETVAAEFVVPDDLSIEVERLAHGELAPLVLVRESSPVLGLGHVMRKSGATAAPVVLDFVEPFLMDADNQPVAGRLGRPGREGGAAERWLLPSFTPHPERWLAVALETWRSLDGERFPARSVWQSQVEWMTPAELELKDRRGRLETERVEAERAFEQQELALRTEEEKASSLADGNERRLLTAQGNDLVAAVISALQELGLHVVDVDEEISTAGDRREDIRVSYDDGTWLALGEIRGYAKGAQLNDLLRLVRFVTRFVREEQRSPSAVWYVVNHFRGSDPSVRPLPLESNGEEVQTFAEDGGVVIDTRDLFRLLMSVRLGEMTAEDARSIVRNARGRLDSI